MIFSKDYTHGLRSFLFPYNKVKNRYILLYMFIITLFSFSMHISVPANASELMETPFPEINFKEEDKQTLATPISSPIPIDIERAEVEYIPPPPPPPPPPAPAPKPRPAPNAAVVGEAQAYARTLVSSDAEWNCLFNLWQRESGWRVEAYNAYSGATGIPQALPGSKMASAGADWETNPVTQINWGMGYINGRYGSPCNAWAHSEAKGWY